MNFCRFQCRCTLRTEIWNLISWFEVIRLKVGAVNSVLSSPYTHTHAHTHTHTHLHTLHTHPTTHIALPMLVRNFLFSISNIPDAAAELQLNIRVRRSHYIHLPFTPTSPPSPPPAGEEKEFLWAPSRAELPAEITRFFRILFAFSRRLLLCIYPDGGSRPIETRGNWLSLRGYFASSSTIKRENF